MVKITQIFKNSFNKVKNSLTHSSKDKKTKNGYYSEQTTTQEVSSQTRESILETTRQINSTLKNSQKAKDNSKKLQDSSNKPKLTSNDKEKKNTTKKSIQSPKKSSKSTSKVQNYKTKKVPIKKNNNASNYPSGKIVKSQLLTEIEKGYLELAGFKNYKDAFIGLENSMKRSEIAKKVATQTSTLTTILKKLELLQVKGIGENVAFVLSQVGVSSLKKLEGIDSDKIYAKINSYTKKHDGVDVKISPKQLKQFAKEAKSAHSVF